MLAQNNCMDIFWMGNLKNRDLEGNELKSQNESEDEDGEEEEEEDIEDDESDVEMEDDDEEAEETGPEDMRSVTLGGDSLSDDED